MHFLKAASSFLAIALPLAAAVPTQVLTKDFPDPSITYDVHSGKWYTFATAGNGLNVQIASGPSATGPWTWLDITILPDNGPWATDGGVWAPDVRYIPTTDSYVLYYSIPNLSNTGRLCVGAASSKSITGPYTPQSTPIACPLDQGGAIDPAGYYDVDSNTRWLLYKVDGNSIGHGGLCNNAVEPLVPTPIMMQQLSLDGLSTIGTAFELLDRGPADGPLIEAPSLIKTPDGTYVLFFSSNCFNTPYYDVTYATAPTLSGPYTKYGPLYLTGDYGLTSPGGATSVDGGGLLVFHANCPDVGGSGRCMYQTSFSYANNVVTTT